MNIVKKIISIILCVILMCSGTSLASFATDEKVYDNFTYTVTSGKVTIVGYPETGKGSVTIPSTIEGKSVVAIDDGTFQACTVITEVIIPNTVTSIGEYAFAYCVTLKKVTIPSSVTSIGNRAFYYCTSLKDVDYEGDKEDWKKISIGSYNEPLTNATIKYNVAKNIYNLGEETYGFENFADSDSEGHCFGMSITSSGYYTKNLDILNVGIYDIKKINTLSLSKLVRKPICYYQKIQGSYSLRATVAGGSYYKNKEFNIASDWNEVINYVKNHKYDNKGCLQIGFKKGSSGHAINFLYYAEVSGQQRIYAYDNNFPNVETYFYKSIDGKVYQEPYSTFSGAIDCIALRDVSKYYSLAKDYDSSRCLYAEKDSITINNAEAYQMESDNSSNDIIMFEIPKGVDSVVIVPLVDNAEFEYIGHTYSFDTINDDTVGVFKLAKSNDDTCDSSNLQIVSKSEINVVSINTPSITTISYGDSIILHANVENLPTDGYVVWTTDNENFGYSVSADGSTCKITPKLSGTTTFTATVYDKGGNKVSSDTQQMKSKAGFFDKFISFFKSIFGLHRNYPE